MSQYPRYAVYFVPPADSVLYRFGASLIGYDAYSGQSLPFIDGIEAEVQGWKRFTTDPRKYGFHATLKAPLSLAPGKTEDELVAAVRDVAQTPRAIPVIAPAVRNIGSFIAIVPDVPCPALHAFADDCVTAIDDFRAPLTAADRERPQRVGPDRAAGRISGPLGLPLRVRGIPLSHDTGRLSPAERRAHVTRILQRRFDALALHSISIDRLALFRQIDAHSGFTIIAHWPLQAT